MANFDDLPPEPAMAEEAALIAQSKDPTEYTELEWHIINPPGQRSKTYRECDLGSCQSPYTHHVELLSGKMFFGCEQHVDELIGLRVAGKKGSFK